MATERQILANKANAQKSTGPRTEQGKKVSSIECGDPWCVEQQNCC